MHHTDVDKPLQKCPGSQDDGPRLIFCTHRGYNPLYPSIVYNKPLHHGLNNIYIFLQFQRGSHGPPIGMPVLSVARPISPPRASISRTRCPLAMPPIAGLQDISPILSISRVMTRVLHPSLADARAASHPACPAPTTMTS